MKPSKSSQQAIVFGEALLAQDDISADDYSGYLARFIQETSTNISLQYEKEPERAGQMNVSVLRIINTFSSLLNYSGKVSKINTITQINKSKQDAIIALNFILRAILEGNAETHIIIAHIIIALDKLDPLLMKKFYNEIINKTAEFIRAREKLINENKIARTPVTIEEIVSYLNLPQMRENYIHLSAAMKECKQYQKHLEKVTPAGADYHLKSEERLTWNPPENQKASLETKAKLNQKMINIITDTEVYSTAEDSLRQIRIEINEFKNRNILSTNQGSRFRQFINALAGIVTLGLWTTQIRGVSNFWRSHGADHVDRLSDVIQVTSPNMRRS